MDSRQILRGSTIYIGETPVTIGETESVTLEAEHTEGFQEHSWNIPRQSCTLTIETPDSALSSEIRELFYNYIVPYWQANHRGNSLHYISWWPTVRKYLTEV